MDKKEYGVSCFLAHSVGYFVPQFNDVQLEKYTTRLIFYFTNSTYYT